MQKQAIHIPSEFRKNYDITHKSLKSTLLRFLIVSTIGFLVVVFVTVIFEATPNPLKDPLPYFFSIILFNLLSEGNIIINRILDRKSPWLFSIKKRMRKQLGYSLLWTVALSVSGFIAIPAYYTSRDYSSKSFALFTTFGIIFVLIFNHLLFIRSFIRNWKESVLENEALKQAKLKADYQVLQNQLNPHFLFNNFSVLISEIHYNPKRAAEFTLKLSEVYRYILQRQNDLLVSLKQELEFVDNYLFLHKIRMGHLIAINVKIFSDHLHLQLPPFSLYMLMENAIKHNRASEKSPLNIEVLSLKGDEIKVTNNVQPKKNVDSTGTGLDNNMKRYSMISEKRPRVEITENQFSVILPLLSNF